jgi:hypothetical protein
VTNTVLARMRGAPEGIRTPNLLIRSQMLYPLSYGRLAGRESNRMAGADPPEGTRIHGTVPEGAVDSDIRHASSPSEVR